MNVKTITGKTEELGILVTDSTQVIMLKSSAGGGAGDFTNEEIEIELIDFTTGKQTPILKKTAIDYIGEIAAQGGNFRRAGTAMVEVADLGKLYLDANRALKINLTGLNGAYTYKVNTLPTEEMSETGAVIYEEMMIPSGITNQKFPTPEGNFLVLPKTNLGDIRATYTDNTEVRLSAEDLQDKAEAMNGIISQDSTGTSIIFGAEKLFLFPLAGKSKRVKQMEINLSAGTGYKMIKVLNMEKTGFDSRY